ncbi:MAG: helix-turn-helix transcriptional regulator [Clostridia bacterium]|nr:helix-turn-helix transcriptional regulator [Clostridia bacterium]
MDIGAKIKAARLAKGMTQEELGAILGVQKSAIAKYESGRVVNIKRSTLKKISDVLNIPPFELIFDEEHRKIQKKNDILSDIILKMDEDEEFFSMVEILSNLGFEQRAAVKSVLTAFSIADK